MSLLKNAVDSIRVGVQDYLTADPSRGLSALRNISAGILLLYKEKLCRLSPAHDRELLIRKDIRPIKTDDGRLEFEGKGKKTVDVQAIKERFASLAVNVEWARFDEVNQLRNDIEHYYTDKSPDAVREVVAKSFLLIRDFVVGALDDDPRELMGAETWGTLLEVADVYQAEEAACADSLSRINWPFGTVEEALAELRCPECHSALVKTVEPEGIYPSFELACSSCGHEFLFEDVVEQCIEDHLAGEAYVAMTDGGEPPSASCPECARQTFVFAEECCVACGYEIEYIQCEMCEVHLGVEEQCLDGLCSYCNYVMEKLRND